MAEDKDSKYSSFRCDICDHRVSKSAWLCPGCGFIFWDDPSVFWKPVFKLLSGTLWNFIKFLWIALAWTVILGVIFVPIFIAIKIFVLG